ncbi:LOW QUALITY PROTEIN: hypothetical protein OSB04_015015 [Centaurea solstitialis]|uniref:Reverse transcriptase domain-containing protein n=1 Tax=Centaurea solstitialis TaxID=347529 RepID=A0AA38WG51_9ASTR|nr:LOW QUALITY PROTEIN: hypothetical protein OSB04_015015 [Centaurea solstitialis]
MEAGPSNPPPHLSLPREDLYIHASTTNVSKFVSMELSGHDNYDQWKAQMLCLMETHDMCGLVDPRFDKSLSTEIMKQYDGLLKGWIFYSVSQGVLGTVVDLDSAKLVWNKLKSLYDLTMSFQQDLAQRKLEETKAKGISTYSKDGDIVSGEKQTKKDEWVINVPDPRGKYPEPVSPPPRPDDVPRGPGVPIPRLPDVPVPRPAGVPVPRQPDVPVRQLPRVPPRLPRIRSQLLRRPGAPPQPRPPPELTSEEKEKQREKHHKDLEEDALNGDWRDVLNKLERGNIKDATRDFFERKFEEKHHVRPTITSQFFKRISDNQKHSLEAPFSEQEVKSAVWSCGYNKAPGPDVRSEFWDMVGKDFYEAVKYFESNHRIHPGSNSSFITLVPKVSDPLSLDDYRPINLIGCVNKVISKVLAERLKGVLDSVISNSQTAFIKGRSILDGPLMVNELINWAKKKKKKLLIFKVDFAKAFDTLNWNYLDNVLMQMGFGQKWREWMKGCTRTAKVSVLINGSPTKEFSLGKGVRQGDPLAPFLFILAAEGLTVAMKEAQRSNLFKGIRIGNSIDELSIFQFADDAIFVGEWDKDNAMNLICILKCFEVCSGLKINMGKSRLLGVSVSKEEVTSLARRLKCKEDSIPFRYLGLPVGGNMKLARNWQPLIDKCRSKLSGWKAKTLSIGGRLCLCKSVLGNLGTYFFSLYKAPKKVLSSLESLRCRFFWGGTEDCKKICWTAWDKVIRDKKCGGLGIGSLRALNLAMLVKWKWRERTEPDAKWRTVVRNCNLNYSADGVTRSRCGVWNSIIGTEKDLRDMGINLSSLMQHKAEGGGWSWELESSKNYTVSSLRKLIDGVSLPIADLQTEWIRWIPSKTNVLLWRILTNRLATKDNLQNRGVIMPSTECPLCLSSSECLDHLMATCSTTKLISAHLTNWVDWWPVGEHTVEAIWSKIRTIGKNKVHNEVCKVIGAAYFTSIWAQRNGMVFKRGVKNEKEICRDIQFLAFDWVRCRFKGGKNLSWENWCKAINNEGNTVLHLAVEKGHSNIVESLLRYQKKEEEVKEALEMRNADGSTALHIAAIMGNTNVAQLLLEKHNQLLTISGEQEKHNELLTILDREGRDPLFKAYSSMQFETCIYLLQAIKDKQNSTLPSTFITIGVDLLVNAISAKKHSIALNFLEKFPEFARENDQVLMAIARSFPSGLSHEETDRYEDLGDLVVAILRFIVRLFFDFTLYWCKLTDYDFRCRGISRLDRVPHMLLSWVWRLIFFLISLVFLPLFIIHLPLRKGALKLVSYMNHNKKKEWGQAKRVLKLVCDEIKTLKVDRTHHPYYEGPLLEAACQNAYEVVDEILSKSPQALRCKDEYGHDIIQLAVIHRSEKIYNRVYQTEGKSQYYKTIKDSSDNNMLHLAGRLAPAHELNRITGAALQLQRELQWREELKKFVFPSYITQKNIDKKTPGEVFTKAHEDLVKEGEKWMKTTAESCSITAGLITTIVFAAAITIPGGSDQKGVPLFTHDVAFVIFAISDAISLFTSTITLLVFLSILTTRFSEQDFLLAKTIDYWPLCIVGLYNCHDSSLWCDLVPCLLSSKTMDAYSDMCINLPHRCVFFIVQFPLIVDLYCSTYVPIFDSQGAKFNMYDAIENFFHRKYED